MNNLTVLGGLLKRVDNFDMSTFDERLVFQKTVYFMQTFGINLGYFFNWYVYGPYSSGLASSGYNLITYFNKVPKVKFSVSELEGRFQKFLEFLGDKKNDADWLEILASIHFLKKLHPYLGKEQILTRVKNKQPHFKKAICENAWAHLNKYGLLSEGR